MKVITDIEQGTKEWHDLRRCKVTGTKLEDVMGSPLARLQLISELIAEEGTEQSKILKPTPEMERGTAEEVFAVKRYEEKFNRKVDRVTMCISDKYDWLAVSPDGLVKTKGKYTVALEVKNPDSKTMIFYKIISSTNEQVKIPTSKKPFIGIPMDYKWQVVAEFLVNEELERLDFVVHDARFIDDKAKLHIVEIHRDNPELQGAIAEAWEELATFRDEWMYWREEVLPTWF